MSTRKCVAACALIIGISAPLMAETVVVDDSGVLKIVKETGYSEPAIIAHEGELWKVKGVNESGEEVTVFVTSDGGVLGAAQVIQMDKMALAIDTPVTAANVESVLAEAGFHNIHDVEVKDDVIKAEADDSTGEDYEIHVNALTGEIVHIEDD